MKQLQKNIARYKVIEMRRDLVKNGEYLTAKLLLNLLRDKRIVLGLNDEAYAVEQLLTGVGLKPHYKRDFRIAVFSL